MPTRGAADESVPPLLDETREILSAAIAALPIGMSIAHSDGRVILSNPAAQLLAPLANADGAGHRSPVADLERHVDRAVTPFTLNDQSYVVKTFTNVTAQRELEDNLYRKAYFDDLTGLPNRGLVEQTVDDLIHNGGGKPFAVAFLDVDNFKQINDFFGHGAGDSLLVKLARRISEQLRESDIAGRVGGDEFLIVLSPVESPEQLATFFDDLLRQIGNPFFIDGQEVFSSTSIGVSLYPDHGQSYETLRVNADTAMYRLKGECKGGIRLFESAIGRAVSERLAHEQRLRLAIRDRRLCCAYQPKIDFRSLTVTGVEVLLRWRDERGLIQPPGLFLALATELGLMDEITHIVLDETIAAIDQINAAFGSGASISINIAAKQAADVAFMTSIARAMHVTGFADRFMVELTEDAFLEKSVFQSHVLPLLREHRIRVSIDDFGIGYSSLSALADITADEIKVDRSFITNIHERPRSQFILKAVESLGHALGMEVLVEGVETVEELAYLRNTTTIRFAQGYYFAKPMFLDELPRAQQGARRHAPSRAPDRNRLPVLRDRSRP